MPSQQVNYRQTRIFVPILVWGFALQARLVPSVGEERRRSGVRRQSGVERQPLDNLPRRKRNCPRLTNNDRRYRPIGVYAEAGAEIRPPPLPAARADQRSPDPRSGLPRSFPPTTQYGTVWYRCPPGGRKGCAQHDGRAWRCGKAIQTSILESVMHFGANSGASDLESIRGLRCLSSLRGLMLPNRWLLAIPFWVSQKVQSGG